MKIIMSPWKRIRQLEAEVALAQAECSWWENEARYARREAMVDAMTHFEHRTKHMQAQNEMLMASALEFSSLVPKQIFVSKEMLDGLEIGGKGEA